MHSICTEPIIIFHIRVCLYVSLAMYSVCVHDGLFSCHLVSSRNVETNFNPKKNGPYLMVMCPLHSSCATIYVICIETEFIAHLINPNTRVFAQKYTATDISNTMHATMYP